MSWAPGEDLKRVTIPIAFATAIFGPLMVLPVLILGAVYAIRGRRGLAAALFIGLGFGIVAWSAACFAIMVVITESM